MYCGGRLWASHWRSSEDAAQIVETMGRATRAMNGGW